MFLKGVSPLVATVLLIAVTMTIAVALAFWAQSFTQTSLTNLSNQPIATECQFGNFLVEACSYDSGGKRMTFILDNVGTTDLSNITIFVKFPDNTLNYTQVSGTLPSGTLRSFSAGDISAGYSGVTFRTNCPNVFKEMACK